jgi:hypothetical protein
MPLQSGSSKATILANYKELVRSGRDKAQAWAIAYDHAGKSRKKKKKKKD